MEEVVKEEGFTLPSRANARAHSHPAAPAESAAHSITGAEIPGVRQVTLQLGLRLGRQNPPGLKLMLYSHFLELGAKVVDLFLLL